MIQRLLILLPLLLLTACNEGQEPAREQVEIHGQMMTRFSSLEEMKGVWVRQSDRGEGADAVALARANRAIVVNEQGLWLGPELDPKGFRGRKPPKRRDGEGALNFNNDPVLARIIGSDDRNWPPRPTFLNPNNHPPAGSRAQFAYTTVQTYGVLGDETGEVRTCPGTMIYGNGPIGVTAAHCLYRPEFSGGPMHIWIFRRGWTLPHNHVGATGDGSPFTCQPTQVLNGGWVFNNDIAYDVALLKWANCPIADNAKHSEWLYWYNSDWLNHGAPGPGTCGGWATITNGWQWAAPGTQTGPCGPRPQTIGIDQQPSTVNPYWPTSCGMGFTMYHWCGSGTIESYEDTVNGHSGAGNFVSGHPQYGNVLFGVHNYANFWPSSYNLSVARTSHIESWLTGNGVY